MQIPIISIVGKSGSGKTTLIEKLIREIKKRGLRVATIKHHAHPGFEIDKPGKDTWRHAQAGADYVVIAASDKMASIRRLEREPTLDEVAEQIPDVDIILTEGYKRAGKPQIEVVRAERSKEPISSGEELIALATDLSLDLPIPHYDLNDATGIVDMIVQKVLSADGSAPNA